MRILGIDTASAIASVALVDEGELIAEEFHEPAKSKVEAASVRLGGNHAEFILPAIQSLLEQTHTVVSSLSGLAVTIGPGSFTGVRIGLATVKGLAYGCGLPVVGVSTLQANAVRAKEFSGLICSLLDARKNEVYVALFRRDGEALSRLTEDAVGPIDFVIDLLRIHGITEKRPALLVGDGAVVYECQWTRSFGPSVKISLGREYGSLAAQAARLSEHRFRSRSVDDVGAVEPIYLRWSEAERKLRLSTLTS